MAYRLVLDSYTSKEIRLRCGTKNIIITTVDDDNGNTQIIINPEFLKVYLFEGNIILQGTTRIKRNRITRYPPRVERILEYIKINCPDLGDNEYEYPISYTQGAISKTLSTTRTHISTLIEILLQTGEIGMRKKNIKGKNKKMNVYYYIIRD